MTSEALLAAAMNRQSVVGWHVNDNIRMPAAFIQNMQFIQVARRLPYMKVYKPKKKKL